MGKNKVLDSWKQNYIERGEKLGEGGNGEVFCVEKNQEIFALKRLKSKYVNSKSELAKEKRCRFIKEIDIVRDYVNKVVGILPIVDYNKNEYWYVMPKAQTIMEYIKKENLDIESVTGIVIILANTLSKLHANDVSHRDIKPSNIYMYNGVPVLSDFGLVGNNEEDGYTKSNVGLGATFTIAPEMKRNPKRADGKKADVYSLAKTMWMMITGNELGFDGTYDYEDKMYSLSYNKKLKDEHLVELETIIHKATLSLPDNRPTMDEFKTCLEKWIRIRKDLSAIQNSEWDFISSVLFGNYIPKSTEWTNLDVIVGVLNNLTRLPVYNHMFFPDRGGLDLDGVEVATEKGCIYVYTDPCGCYVIKPKRLIFEGFDNPRWNYFLLELDNLTPIVHDAVNSEYLVEDYPGHYVSGSSAQYGVYDYDTEEKLPEGYRVVVRYLRGSFLITEKFGPYNNISGTYDARHNLCSNQTFRLYIESMIKIFKKGEAEGLLEEQIAPFFNTNPFYKDVTFEHEKTKKRPKKRLREYILENIENWNFLNCLKVEQSRRKNIFKFELYPLTHAALFSGNKFISYTLCKDGFFCQPNKESKIYYAEGKECAYDIYGSIRNQLLELCAPSGYEKDEVNDLLRVTLSVAGRPSHIISKKEISQLMKSADDRKDNTLVIDEEGYAHIIQDQLQIILYPIVHETWEAGNNYVGKYSDLSGLDTVYELLIFGLYRYLMEKRRVCCCESIIDRVMGLEKCVANIENIIMKT